MGFLITLNSGITSLSHLQQLMDVRCKDYGGGTGGGTNYLAEQLNHTNSEVVYIDFSVISMDISKKRAKVRKTN